MLLQRTHKAMSISEKNVTNKSAHYKNKTFNLNSQTIAVLNPRNVVTTPPKFIIIQQSVSVG